GAGCACEPRPCGTAPFPPTCTGSAPLPAIRSMSWSTARPSANNRIGIFSSGASSTIRINQSVITGNILGLYSTSGGVLHWYKDNAINDNVADGTPITQDSLN